MEHTQPSNTESWNSGGTADVLVKERAKATFDVVKLTNILDGGPEKTKRRMFILSPTRNMDVSGKWFWTRKEALGEHVKHFIKTHEAYWESFIPTREEAVWMMEYSMLSGSLMNHYGLFLPTVAGSGNDEQRIRFAFPALQCKIIGCYAQTELGHGSNVRGLQTIAEYDKNTQEFVLNTPTLASMKWWPGALGKVATHAAVYAQLIIEGKEYGVHAFVSQIRDENHHPYPGIELGDLGPKMGDPCNDTGYMRLRNVRIPRENMLAAHQQVTPDGEYIKSSKKKTNDKLHYATMMFTRGTMVKGAGGFLARAVTIAIRYSCVRRQGFVNSKTETYKGEERQIIDHQVQRYRLFRQLALAYAIKFTGSWMLNSFKDLESNKSGVGLEIANLDALPLLAASSAGLKALCTYLAWQGIEDCRKCCGGNGYLLSSGIAGLAADYVWQTTAEGDWVVLMLNSARFLIKTLNGVMKGESVPGPVDYLAAVKEKGFNPNAQFPLAASLEEFRSLDYLYNMFKHRAVVTVFKAGEQLQQSLSKGATFDQAWDEAALALLNAVRAHCFYFLFTNFRLVIDGAEDLPAKNALAKLCALYACSNIVDEPQWIGHLSHSHMTFAQQAVTILMEEIRPDAVTLVDAFDFPDRVLNSTIGRYDGNVYEALYESARKSPLNQSDPFDGYETLKPYLDDDVLKQGNTVANL